MRFNSSPPLPIPGRGLPELPVLEEAMTASAIIWRYGQTAPQHGESLEYFMETAQKHHIQLLHNIAGGISARRDREKRDYDSQLCFYHQKYPK